MQTYPAEAERRDDASSLLDAQETSPRDFEEKTLATGNPLDLQSTQQRIAHRRHEGTRRRIILALHHHGDAGLNKRAHRLAACCCCPTFRTSENAHVSVNLARCRDRLCPLCSYRRGLQATAKVLHLTHQFNAPRLVTLTLRSDDSPLKAQVFRLLNRFAFLRTMKGWSSRVTGGIWTLEVTRNPTTCQWHAHLHIIVDGEFFPQPVLKKLWHEATGDSFIVDIRAIHDRERTAKYVAGYLAKPADVAGWPNTAITEYALALHGRRLMQPFGTARKVELDQDDDENPSPPSHVLCSAHTLLAACSAHYEPALRARDILARISPDHAIAASVAPPQLSGCCTKPEASEIEEAFTTLERLQKFYPNLPSDISAPIRERAAPKLPPPNLYSDASSTHPAAAAYR